MKLDDYVAETIKQIIKGINTAKDFGDEHGAKVNPESASFPSGSANLIFCVDSGVPLQEIMFDIAVSVSEGSGSSESPELTVGSNSITGTSQSSESIHSSLNRIKFSIPVRLPMSNRDQ